MNLGPFDVAAGPELLVPGCVENGLEGHFRWVITAAKAKHEPNRTRRFSVSYHTVFQNTDQARSCDAYDSAESSANNDREAA